MDHQDEECRTSPKDATATVSTPHGSDAEEAVDYQSDIGTNEVVESVTSGTLFPSTTESDIHFRIGYPTATCLLPFTSVTHLLRLDSLTTEKMYCIRPGDTQDIRAGNWKLSLCDLEKEDVVKDLRTFLVFDGNFHYITAYPGSSARSSPTSRAGIEFSRDEDSNDEQQASDVQEPLLETKSTNPRKRRFSEPESASPHKRRFTELESGETSVGELFAKSPAEQNDDGDNPPSEYLSKPMGESDEETVWRSHRSTAKGMDYVFVKRLHQDATSRTKVAQSFEHEVAILQGLDHPNIVKLIDHDVRNFTLYLEGLPSTLEALIKIDMPPRMERCGILQVDDLFSEREYVAILHDVCSALAHMLEQGCFHNNIQPAHITYGAERGAVLIGLGRATTVKEPRFTGCATWYTAPELLQTKRGSTAGDVWALGVTMLPVMEFMSDPKEMVPKWPVNGSGDMFNHANSSYEGWLAVVAETRSRLRLNRKVERLVYDMLDPNPESRIKVSAILSELGPMMPPKSQKPPKPQEYEEEDSRGMD